ncbi:MAG TPA: HDOD domain-containing protein [Bacteroidetes bacterium]|nr:HDOD domain-containing protein [Bacteroidota bacterium]
MRNARDVVSQIQSLPTLPQVVQNVVALVDNPDTSSSQLAQVISSDSGLVSKILKVVNSAYYGLPRKVSTLTQATVILGFHTIKNLVLTASVFSIFSKNGHPERFNRAEFWKHSLGCATASKVLAKRIRLGLPEEAFIAGLLHDIGKIVLDQFAHEDFEAVLDYLEANNVPFREAEEAVLGVDHTQIGSWLCDKWNFPLHVQEVVSFHHTPKLAEVNRKLVSIVHLADAIARWENLGNGGDRANPEFDPENWQILNIPEEELGEIIQEVIEEYGRAVILLDLFGVN